LSEFSIESSLLRMDERDAVCASSLSLRNVLCSAPTSFLRDLEDVPLAVSTHHFLSLGTTLGDGENLFGGDISVVGGRRDGQIVEFDINVGERIERKRGERRRSVSLGREGLRDEENVLFQS